MKKSLKISLIILIIIIAIIVIFIAFNVWLNIKPNIDKIKNCNVDSDCVVVAKGYCGGAEAINKDYYSEWGNYLKKQNIKHSFTWARVYCKVSLSLDFFEAKCNENKCEAIQKIIADQNPNPECETFYGCLPSNIHPGLTGCGGCYLDENGDEICYEWDEELCQEFKNKYACIKGICQNSKT